MSKYCWATDIHLDHIDDNERLVAFSESLIASDPSGIFLTGDVSNANRLVYHLSVIERVVQRPIFFVLGNHDYYGSSIEQVRKSMRELTNMSQFLRYMPLNTFLSLSQSTALVGHDGWYDALNGNALDSRFLLMDWQLITDFIPHSGGAKFMNIARAVSDKQSVISLSQKLAHEGVTHMMNGIKAAIKSHKNIVVLTHVPPFQESHIYKGKVGDSSAQPWYTSKMCGDMLLNAARTYPNTNFTVLAGHTHGRYDGKPLPNLSVHVGGSEYGSPVPAGLIDVT